MKSDLNFAMIAEKREGKRRKGLPAKRIAAQERERGGRKEGEGRRKESTSHATGASRGRQRDGSETEARSV